MSFFKSLFGSKSEDDRLYDEFLRAMGQMKGPEAERCIDKMSDEGLMKTTYKINELIKTNPSYMLYNTLLFAAFAKRPHLENPFA